MLEEFGLQVDIHLGDRGVAARQDGADGRARSVRSSRSCSALGLTPVPYIHGDTLTSMAVGVSVLPQPGGVRARRGGHPHHHAAGRGAARVLDDYRAGRFDWDAYAEAHAGPRDVRARQPRAVPRAVQHPRLRRRRRATTRPRSSWTATSCSTRGSRPTPSRSSATPSSTPPRRPSPTPRRRRSSTTYPQLQGGRFIRICIHRRENTEDGRASGCCSTRWSSSSAAAARCCSSGSSAPTTAIDRFGLRGRLEALRRTIPDTFISSAGLAELPRRHRRDAASVRWWPRTPAACRRR